MTLDEFVELQKMNLDKFREDFNYEIFQSYYPYPIDESETHWFEAFVDWMQQKARQNNDT